MKGKKFLSLILAAGMALGTVTPTAYSSVTADSGSTETIGGNGLLKVGAEGEYSTVYYGGIPWRVLSKSYSDGQEEATDGILLLSEHAMANGIRYNAHYSNNRWSSKGKDWASAQWMPWDDPRNPSYESNIANGTKTDDSSGGYITSDIRMYLTGKDGNYETIRPYAYYNEAWPANWWGTPDRNSQANKYYVRNEVTDSEPQDGVTYFVKGSFELSDHDRTGDEDGIVPITAADWAENTWYTLDGEGNPVLMTEWPEGATTVNAYFDQAGYSIADVSEGFEAGVTYYTFERLTTDGDVLPTVTTNGVDYAMGEHLAGLYKFVAYSIPELSNTNSANATVNEVFVNGLPASEKNFATDMGFTAVEQAAVLPTSGHGYTQGTGVNVGVGSTYGDRLDNDTYFSLSGEEVQVYLKNAGHTKSATYFDGTGVGDIWTRSWGKSDTQCVIVYTNNACSWRQGANNTWQSVRPAFNLNPSAAAFYTAIDGKENTYKMTLTDNARNFSVDAATRTGDTLTISYSGAVVGANEYFAYLLKDKTTGAMVETGTFVPVTEENGTVALDVSDVDMLNYDVFIFNEQVNGELDSNYASNMVKVECPLSDYTFSITTDRTAMKATETLTATIAINEAFYMAEYTFTYDVDKFSCDADTDGDGKIYVTKFKGAAGDLDTYNLVAKNDIQSVSLNNIITVTGNVIQYKEQILNDMVNNVVGDTESIKISLNYTAEVKVDYVQGYSLVLVRGNDEGYAYNGVKMFYVEAYGAYAILVEGVVTEEMIDEALTKTTGCETIRQSYDVNAEYVTDGVVDLKDAAAVYACASIDFNVAEYMELYLRADVNGDGVVDMVDLNVVTENYTI